jgi:hypothetical protein
MLSPSLLIPYAGSMSEGIAPRRRAMSDDALREATGRDWEAWFAVLDAWGATEHDHTAIAAHLVEDLGVDGWWAQTVTVGYEQERGMRLPGQRPDGTFSASASKTLPADAVSVFERVADEEQRPRWLTDLELSQRSAAPPKSIRFDASDDTRVSVVVVPKGPSKTAVQVQVERLASAEDVPSAKAAWRERLDRLADSLGS